MTLNQQRQVAKVRDHINDVRVILDGIMYGEEGWCLNDKEFERIRKAYDLICEANDAL